MAGPVARLMFAAVIGSVAWGGYAQVLSEPPRVWSRSTPLGLFEWLEKVDLPYNKPEAIHKELLDPQLIRLIAASEGLSAKQLASVKIAAEPRHDWINVYQVGKSEKAFQILSEVLRAYVRARRDGHTQAFLLNAITNQSRLSANRDPYLRMLATNSNLVGISWATKTSSGTTTNKAGVEADRQETTKTVNGKQETTVTVHVPKVDELCHWVNYRIIDKEIAWNYFVQFKADGRVNYISKQKSDAKEYDERYKGIVEQVNKEVTVQMQQNGSYGKFGSCHQFWHLKKDKLKAKGIDWRSPTELNPGTSYD